jgi:hypothetical protein
MGSSLLENGFEYADILDNEISIFVVGAGVLHVEHRMHKVYSTGSTPCTGL